MKKRIFEFFCIVAIVFLSACNTDETQQSQTRSAVNFERADECHLCGMVITRFPGPKAQLFEREVKKVRKFCSTRDMFSYFLQPENTHRVTDIYVHDMAKSPWDKPDDHYLIDARQAWYVINHQQTGAMGPTLASFGQKSDAVEFSQAFGGSIVRFEDVTLKMLMSLSSEKLESEPEPTHIENKAHDD